MLIIIQFAFILIKLTFYKQVTWAYALTPFSIMGVVTYIYYIYYVLDFIVYILAGAVLGKSICPGIMSWAYIMLPFITVGVYVYAHHIIGTLKIALTCLGFMG